MKSWSKKKLNEFVVSSLMDQKSERKNLDKFAKNLLMNRNGNHEHLQMMVDDVATDQCVNRSKKPQMVTSCEPSWVTGEIGHHLVVRRLTFM